MGEGENVGDGELAAGHLPADAAQAIELIGGQRPPLAHRGDGDGELVEDARLQVLTEAGTRHLPAHRGRHRPRQLGQAAAERCQQLGGQHLGDAAEQVADRVAGGWRRAEAAWTDHPKTPGRYGGKSR